MRNCQVCGQDRDELYMLFRNDLYFCNTQCYSSFYSAVNTRGADVEFNKSTTHLQWRYLTDTVWIDLIPLTELKGDPGSVGTLTQEQIDIILAQIPDPDLSGKVDKVTGSSLLPNTEAVKIHVAGSDDQDLSGLVIKVTGKSLVSDTEIAKIHADTLDHSHTNKIDLDDYDPDDYSVVGHEHLNDHAPHSDDQDISGKSDIGHTHAYEPANSNIQSHVTSGHAPSNAVALSTVKADTDIASAISLKHGNSLDHSNSQDHSHTNKTTLDAITAALTTALKTDYDNAVTHAGSAHAPSTAEKNSDITKSEIEAKLIGEIATHTHAGGAAGLGMAINVQALTSSPTDSQTIYFGMLPKAPVTTAGQSKIYIRKTCTLKIAEIYCYSGTAGSNESWSLYVRKNNTTDTLIATLSVSASERVFTNATLAISLVAGDYIEIKGINPLWGTNPLTCIFSGYLYFE
jgi:hypothetical protein